MSTPDQNTARLSLEERLARCSDLARSLSERLSFLEDPYRKVRRAAANAIADLRDPALLSTLAVHRFPEVRRQAALHPSTPQTLLRLLQKAGASRDLSSYTEARQPLSGEERATLLGGGIFARCLLARRPGLSEEEQERLASDPSVEVRALFAQHQSRALPLSGEAYRVRRAAAKNSSSVGALQSLSQDKNPGVRAAVASNLSCPPEVFEKLLHQEKRTRILQGAARNPSLSKEWLLLLAEKFPKEIFQNPAFPLLQLEDPSLTSKLGRNALRFLAAMEPLPGAFAQSVLDEPERWFLLGVLARNPSTPASVLTRLLCHDWRPVRQKALKNPSAPQEVIQLLYRAGATEAMEVEEGAEGPLTQEEQERLLELGGFATLLLAHHGNTLEEIKLRLVDLRSQRIDRALLKSSKALSEEVLQRMERSGDAVICEMLGFRPELPLEKILSWEAPSAAFWRGVAQRPSLPAPVVEALLTHEDSNVRKLVTKREDLSELQRKRLLLDKEALVREEAARHPKSPKDFLAALFAAGASPSLHRCAPPKKEVSGAFLREIAGLGFFGQMLEAINPKISPERLAEYAGREEIPLLASLVQNPALPHRLMRWFSQHPSAEIRAALLKNPSLVGEALEALAQDYELEAASHPNTPPSVLHTLASSKDKTLALQIAKNPAATAEVLATLVSSDPENEALLSLIVEHPNVDERVLLQLAARVSQRVRILAARHKLFSEKARALFVKAGSSANLICYGAPDLSLADADLRRVRALGPFGRALAILHPNATTPFLAEELAFGNLASLFPIWEQFGEEVLQARRRARSDLYAFLPR